MRYDHYTLPNGLHIVGEHNSAAQSLAIGFFTRTGSRDETPEISGVSHFLEHMMFKGSERRAAADVNREFDEIGARNNAFTSQENTVYYGAVLPEFQDRLLDLLGDMLRPSLRDEDFDTEKKVILEEIAMYKDRPRSAVFDLARETYHHGHPLGNSVLGSTESITALARDQMRDYFEQRYAPNNMTLVLVGNYDWDAAVRQVEQLCGDWKPAEAPRSLSQPEPFLQERMAVDTKHDRLYLCAVAPAPSAQDETRFAAELVAEMLGGGDGSRLYWALTHPGLADTAGLFYDSNDGAGAFYAFVSCDPVHAREVMQVLRMTLEDMQREAPPEEELDRARRKVASGLVIGAETPMGRLTSVGFDWVYRRRIAPLEEVVDRYLGVSGEDVAALLQQQPFDRLTLAALGPEPAALGENLAET
ncbi:MAG TPA: pitrilysin family protein [Herpetosiphonaceae bacterium]|nr:pitrilysin family protein [Herpetosiphonaceae bacterium]